MLCVALLGLLRSTAADQVLSNLLDRVRTEVTGGVLPVPRLRDFGAVLDSQHASRDAAYDNRAEHAEEQHSLSAVSKTFASTASSSSSATDQHNISVAATQPDGALSGQGASAGHLPSRATSICLVVSVALRPIEHLLTVELPPSMRLRAGG